MTLITQAEFARRKQVTRAAVSQWAREKRLIFSGKLIDLEATEASMLANSRHRSKRSIPALAGVNLSADTIKPQLPVNATTLPEPMATVVLAIESGADDIAFFLARRMPIEAIRTMVDQWVAKQRVGWVEIAACEEWEPPPGGGRWSDHSAFTGPALTASDWSAIEAEAAAARATQPPEGTTAAEEPPPPAAPPRRRKATRRAARARA
jgi:transcriptional regulator with XRE-family HTH domain